MPKSFYLFFIFIIASSLILQPAFANHQINLTGNDISYPQCGKTYPTKQAFGIVGVNDGLANTTNPCLSSELVWANKSLNGTNQAIEQLYANTANPGGLNTPSWPQDNTDPTGNTTTNPYGICNGANSSACSWQYGWDRAVEDVQNRFMPAAQSAGLSTNPSDYPWWLDVETINTWESGSMFSFQANTADLEGMVAYFQSKNTAVGIYSTNTQWAQIVGNLSSSSSLNGLNNWIPGAHNLSGAKSNCALAPLTPGGKVIITQYSSSTFDYDNSCI